MGDCMNLNCERIVHLHLSALPAGLFTFLIHELCTITAPISQSCVTRTREGHTDL